MKKIQTQTIEHGYRLTLVEIEDPYKGEALRHRKAISDEISNQILPEIKKYLADNSQHQRGDMNPVSDSFFRKSAILARWLDDIPSSKALFPLQKPELESLADGTKMDDVSKQYFPNVLDGIAIRRRARLMTHLMTKHFVESNITTPKWASLASGSAIPVLDSIEELNSHGIEPKLTLYDISGKALKFSKQIAANHYSINEMDTVKMNILRLRKLQNRIGKDSQDAIDILGFFEYIPRTRWTYKPGITFPGAVDFLKTSYSLLKKGGLMVFGNMSTSHPELEFTLNVVRWPLIIPRSVKEIAQILHEAGVPENEVEIFEITDRVYYVVSIVKK